MANAESVAALDPEGCRSLPATRWKHGRLSFLGEVLRALLVMEMRQLSLVHVVPCEKTPAHLPAGSVAVRCGIRSVSGAVATVVLGGPAAVVNDNVLVEYALRQTLVADSLSLQFKLPPSGSPAPKPHSRAEVAAGAALMEALAATSVWAVQVLRGLSQDSSFRGLAALSIGGIGGTSVAAFAKKDAERWAAIMAANEPPAGTAPPGLPLWGVADGPTAYPAAGPAPPPRRRTTSPPRLSDALPAQSPSTAAASEASPLAGPDSDALPAALPSPEQPSAGRATSRTLWKTNRRPMSQCARADFNSDLCKFLAERRGKVYDLVTFPEAILNGSQLDLFNLYREVTSRGGFKLGNGINWKGQVFPRMSNFTSTHKMTGVGNALKRHYQHFLLEYELANPADVGGDKCSLCLGGDEISTDWICCDTCHTWVHFSCDKRTYLGAFKDYAKGQGRNYTCGECYENNAAKKQRTS